MTTNTFAIRREELHQVWVLGTWSSAEVVYDGTIEQCVDYRKNAPNRSRLSVRPTGFDLSGEELYVILPPTEVKPKSRIPLEQ